MKLAKKFMANNKPIQKSKLSEINEDILLLVENNFPTKQIHEFIVSDAKISVDLSWLYKYIKKLKNKNDVENLQETSKSQKRATTTIVEEEETDNVVEEVEEIEETVDDERAAFMKFLKQQDELGIKPGVTEYKPKFESSWIKKDES